MVAEKQTLNSQILCSLLIFLNIIPFLPMIYFQWQVHELLFIYWIEIGLAIGLYSVILLFAQPNARSERKIEKLDTTPESKTVDQTRLNNRLPPLYWQNSGHVFGALIFGLIFWYLSHYGFLTLSNPDLGVGARPELQETIPILEAGFSAEGIGIALVLFAVRLAILKRTFFRYRTYESMQAPTLTEISRRYSASLLPLVIVTFVLSLSLTIISAQSLVYIAIILVLVPGKIFIDFSVIQIHLQNRQGTFSWWLLSREFRESSTK